jgi:hypothetical protein
MQLIQKDASSGDAPETAELRAFREQWRAEVRQRKGDKAPARPPAPHPHAEEGPPSASAPASDADSAFVKAWAAQEDVRPAAGDAPSPSQAQAQAPGPMPAPARLRARDAPDFTFGPRLTRAIYLYRDAVHAEQRGDLDAALVLYRSVPPLLFLLRYLSRSSSAPHGLTSPAPPARRSARTRKSTARTMPPSSKLNLRPRNQTSRLHHHQH